MNEPHPWGVFLEARAKCITYFRRNGKTDRQIAHDLSMDEDQVFFIAKYQESLERKENVICVDQMIKSKSDVFDDIGRETFEKIAREEGLNDDCRCKDRLKKMKGLKRE